MSVRRRFLELQSSGRKDEIRLHYTHAGEARVETFSHRLADGAWHRLAVTVSGGVVTLYVDCQRVERRIMSAVPDASLPASAQDDPDGEMAVWIGQRGDQHFLFKVSTSIAPHLQHFVMTLNNPSGCHARCPPRGRKQWASDSMPGSRSRLSHLR